MERRTFPLAIIGSAALSCAVVAGSVQAEPKPVARLVHCGADTCLRLSGHRSGASVAVRVDGRNLPVEGARAWRITVPLSTARTWSIGRRYSVAVSLVDDGMERATAVPLPPGSLGSPLELASLTVRTH